MTHIHPFDLQARAELAVQSLTSLRDVRRDGLMYFLADWRARPPRADHGLWDCGDGSGRHIDALTLARSILPQDSPAARPDQGESQFEGWMFRLLADEGLSWLPHDEPWAAPWGTELVLADWQPEDVIAEVSWAQRGTLLGLTSRFVRTGDERYLTAAQRMVDGLLRVAIQHPDGLFYPEGYYRRGGWHSHKPGLYAGIEEYNAAVLVPLVRFYQASHYEPAIRLAEELARFALKHTHGYTPDGRLQMGPRIGVEDHLHTRTNFILGVLELGVEVARPEYIAWARQAYEHAKEWGTEFGWFPEGLGHRHGEICCTTDMIEAALLLGRNVSCAYYADAERFGRNHLLESQYLSLEQLRVAVSKLPASTHAAPYGGQFSTTEGVTESQVGAFAARSTLNDAFHLDATSLMQCCNAAGTRGLYDLWHDAVDERPGDPPSYNMHLRFSVKTPALRVVSYEPAIGRLDILPQHHCRVAVRLPDATRHAFLVRTESGITDVQSLEAQHGYVVFDAAASRELQVHYALTERVAHYQVGASPRTLSCTGYWRGETLMRIDPPGEYYPLYQRANDAVPVHPR